MTIQEFLDTYFPTQAPKPNDIAKPWAGYLANLYTAATGLDATTDSTLFECGAAGYAVKTLGKTVAVSEKELRRCDRKFADQMVANYKAGRGV
jgi:hypothetical protein